MKNLVIFARIRASLLRLRTLNRRRYKPVEGAGSQIPPVLDPDDRVEREIPDEFYGSK